MNFEDIVCLKYPHLFKLAQAINGVFILISLGSTSTVDGGGALWFICVLTFLVSVIAAVLFLLDKSDLILNLTGNTVSWNHFEFIYSSIFSVLCLMGVWLAFTYSTRVTATSETTGYMIAGFLLVLQTTFYTAPSVMLYPKIKDESKPQYNVHGNYENDADISYQGAPVPRIV